MDAMYFVFNRDPISQAGRRRFEPGLPLTVICRELAGLTKIELGFDLNTRNQKRRQWQPSV